MKLVIKIGGDMLEDIAKVFADPRKAEPGTHTHYVKSCEELYELLSPKRMELLMRIIREQSKKKTISELAVELKRKQEAVSRDATFLESQGMLEKKKEKRAVYLKPKYKSLEIKLAGA